MKKFYKLFPVLVLIAFFTNRTAVAQVNLAPSATATAYTPDPGGLYNWSQINDLSFNTCGNQESFIWTSNIGIQGTEQMTFTWTSAKSMNKIRFHNAQNNARNLTGADVYYYNGSTYVFWKAITIQQACLDSVTFPTITTTSLRLTNFKMTGSGQQSNPNWREIEIISAPSLDVDAGVSGFNPINICNYTQALDARVFNFGKKTLDSFKLHWSINNVNQTSLNVYSSLISARDTGIRLNANFTFTANTTYRFKLWTSAPNGLTDSIPANDTLVYTVNFLGNPTAPSTTPIQQCGNGRPMLTAIPALNTDSIMWFDANTGGKFLGIGRSILGPMITSTRTFYAQAIKFGGSVSLGTGFGGTTIITGNTAQFNGSMFNVVTVNSVVVDSLTFKLLNNNPSTNFRLYYKVGTHVGFETTASAWTLISSGSARCFTSNGTNYIRVPTNTLILQPSTTYGFYFTTDPTVGGGNDMFVTNGAISASNGDMTITGNRAIGGLFASQGVYSTWTANVEFMLKKQCTNSSRTALTVTVKPRPIGADFSKGAPFKGQYRVGDMSKPDVAEVGKNIVYDIVPPTGYNNSNYNTTWLINSVTATTRYGYTVNSSEYIYTPPTGSNSGHISLTPSSTYLDSFITFSVRFIDLGPYYCDSTIKRTVVIAPTPKPSFKFPASICLGDAVLFDNTTFIHSGTSTYMWYFDDGDSSDLVSPVHEYKQAGTYDIRLVATSFPWGTIEDTIIRVEVGELPQVKYKVNNKCQGIAVTFQNQTVVGSGVLTYDWDFGDNTAHSTVTNPTHLYNNPGGYKVTLTAEANGCKASLSKNAYMFARPIANFLTPLSPVCANSVASLPNTTTLALGQQGAFWTYGDGSSSTQFNGDHVFTAPGTYNVKLLAVSEFDCRDSVTRQVTIKPTPAPDFSADLYCGKKPTTFTNTTNEVVPNPIYRWNFSDGYNSSLKNITRSWPYEGPFTAKLTATYSNGCSASIDKNFEVLIQPKAAFDVKDICSGETAVFANLSTGDRSNILYNWDFGDGVFSNSTAPVKLYNPTSTTTYTVNLVASYNGGCSDTTRKNITVSESPNCDFTFKNLGFLNAQFTPANTGYTSYSWFFGDGGSSLNSTPTYKYAYSGNFNVTMKATNAAGCECELTKKFSANTDVQSVINGSGINVYPNPNNGTFTVSNNSNSGMKVEVFNILGVKVLESNTDESSTVINLNDSARGIYLVKITINGVTSTIKITVTN
ncbi:MAG TPA: PKD domain-containing protein [Bacteroidia bacterium]